MDRQEIKRMHLACVEAGHTEGVAICERLLTSLSQADKARQDLFDIALAPFDISRYDRAEGLNVIQWSQLLMFRYITRGLSAEKGEDGLPCNFWLLVQIIEDPLKRIDFTTPLLYKRNWRSVLTVEDDYIGGSEEACPRIDLSATDEQLVLDFKDWLSEARAAQQKRGVAKLPKRFTEADFAQWNRMRVLAYIDIETLAQALQVGIPQHKLGELLFPDEIEADTTDRIRKSVKPLAKKLMTSEILQAMESQASAECRKGE